MDLTNQILVEKLGRLRFKRRIKVKDLTFRVAPDTGNTWVFHASIGTEEQSALAQKFAEDLGMAIALNSLSKKTFVAWCTNDTYVYILPLKLDTWKGKA